MPFSIRCHDAYRNKGEMEKTMFTAFCAKSAMQATVQHHLSALDGWKDIVAITEQSFGTKKSGAYIPDARTLSLSDESHRNPLSESGKSGRVQIEATGWSHTGCYGKE
jgi:hypothetical protein